MKGKKILSLALAATLMTGTFLLAGCGKDKVEKDATQDLSLIFMEVESWDVNAVYDNGTGTILNATQEPLYRFKPNADGKEELVPAAAEAMPEVSEDGLTYTFKLRKDMEWSDGVKITAQHFVDSIKRIVDPELANPYSFFAFGIKGAEEVFNKTGKPEDIAVVAKDELTFEVTLKKADPTFVGKIAYQCFLPVRLDVIEKVGLDKYQQDYTVQVYSGPYKVTGYTRNQDMKLEKNEKFWDAENVSINNVTMTRSEEFSTQAQLFESKQLDVTGGSGDYLQKWRDAAKAGDFQYETEQDVATWYMAFNNKTGGPSGIMSNAKVRKAFSLAINREEFTKNIYNRFSPALGFIPDPINVGDAGFRKNHEEPLKKDFDSYARDPQKLQALLKEGLKELGKDTENLKDIKVKFITSGQSALAKQANEVWKQTFENVLGITIDLEIIPDAKQYSAARKDFKRWDMVFIGWGADYNDPLTFLDMWESTNGNNYAGYTSEAYDALLKSLDGEKDNAKREEIYVKLENLLVNEDVAIAPVYYADKNVFLQNYVKDFYFPTFGAAYEWRWTYIQGK